VYRTNASYDRFWEGRKLWGSVVNTTRNIMRFTKSIERSRNLVPLAKLLSAYVISLKQRLRNDNSVDEFAKYLLPDLPHYNYVKNSPNKPLAVSAELTEWIQDNCTNIMSCPERMRIVEGYIGQLLDYQGGLERIWNTPVPFAYVSLVHHILTYYLISLPMVLIQDYSWWSIPATILISGSLMGIEQAGIEIEHPFDTNRTNTLDLDTICNTIRDNMLFLATEGKHNYIITTTAQQESPSHHTIIGVLDQQPEIKDNMRENLL
jgi:putative membrane protein